MSPSKILRCVDNERRRTVLKLLRKRGIGLNKVFIVVLYTIGSIQNKFQQRPGQHSNGDYGRRWRRSFDRMIDAAQEEFIKSGVLLIHVNPTRLDAIVAKKSMGKLQPRFRSLQERLKLEQLYRMFNPIRLKELETMSVCGRNIMVIAVVHLAETSVSGGSAQELFWADMAGIPVYLYCSEEILRKYRSRHVIVSIMSVGKTVIKGRNIFHTAEDMLNKIKKDLPRLRVKKCFPPIGRLFVSLWNAKKKQK